MPSLEATVSLVVSSRDVVIDPATSCVRRAGEAEYLRPKTLQVLMYLIGKPNQVVTKEELLEAVWLGTAVTDDTLVQSIGDIRKAVGDDPRDSWFIRTIPRVGYRLVASFESANAAAATPEITSLTEPEASPPTPTRPATALLPLLAGLPLVLLIAGIVWTRSHPTNPAPIHGISRSPAVVTASRDHMTDNLEAYDAYTTGLAAVDNLENSAAIAHFNRAIQLDPQFAMAYARIGYTYGVRWTQGEQARPYLARALQLKDRLNERERLYVVAWQAIASKEFEKAIDYYRLLVDRYPTDVEAFEGLGRLLVGEERLQEAIEVYRLGLIVDPDSQALNNSMGIASSSLGHHEEAMTYHRRYVSLAPRSPNAHDSLGLTYQWAGSYAGALAEYDEALRLDPRFEIALVHRANTFYQLGRIREAIRDFERYIEIAPSSTDRSRGYGELSNLYRGVGDLGRAAPLSRRALHENQNAIFNEIMVAVDRGDAATAKQLVDSLTSPTMVNRGRRYSGRVQFVLRAESARVQGDSAHAIEYARQAVRRLPVPYLIDDYEDLLADTLAAFGRHQEAIAEYRRVLGINAHRGRTRFRMARSLDAMGRHTEAKTEYERFLSEWKGADSDVPELVAARTRLKHK